MSIFDIFKGKRNKNAVSQGKRRRRDTVHEYNGEDLLAPVQDSNKRPVLDEYQQKLVYDVIGLADLDRADEFKKAKIDLNSKLPDGETVATFAVNKLDERYEDVLKGITQFQETHKEALAVMERIAAYKPGHPNSDVYQRAASFLLSENVLQNFVEIPKDEYPKEMLHKDSLGAMIQDPQLNLAEKMYKNALALTGVAIGVDNINDYARALRTADENDYGEEPHDLYTDLHERQADSTALTMMQSYFDNVEFLRKQFEKPLSDSEFYEWVNDPVIQHDFPMVTRYASLKHSTDAKIAAKNAYNATVNTHEEPAQPRTFAFDTNGMTVITENDQDMMRSVEEITLNLDEPLMSSVNIENARVIEANNPEPVQPAADEGNDMEDIGMVMMVPEEMVDTVRGIIQNLDITQASALHDLDANYIFPDNGETLATLAARVYAERVENYARLSEDVAHKHGAAIRLMRELNDEMPDHQMAIATFANAEILTALEIDQDAWPETVLTQDAMNAIEQAFKARELVYNAKHMLADVVSSDGMKNLIEKLDETGLDMNGTDASILYADAQHVMDDVTAKRGLMFDDLLETTNKNLIAHTLDTLTTTDEERLSADIERWSNDPVLQQRFPFIAPDAVAFDASAEYVAEAEAEHVAQPAYDSISDRAAALAEKENISLNEAFEKVLSEAKQEEEPAVIDVVFEETVDQPAPSSVSDRAAALAEKENISLNEAFEKIVAEIKQDEPVVIVDEPKEEEAEVDTVAAGADTDIFPVQSKKPQQEEYYVEGAPAADTIPLHAHMASIEHQFKENLSASMAGAKITYHYVEKKKNPSA